VCHIMKVCIGVQRRKFTDVIVSVSEYRLILSTAVLSCLKRGSNLGRSIYWGSFGESFYLQIESAKD